MLETNLNLKEGFGFPGVFFFLEFGPLMVQIFEKRTPFFLFFPRVCAFFGGFFSVTGLIASFVFSPVKQLKTNLGKLGCL
eukprot:UN13366